MNLPQPPLAFHAIGRANKGDARVRRGSRRVPRTAMLSPARPLGGPHETLTPSVSGIRSGCCRLPRRRAERNGASLSEPPGANDHRLSPRRLGRRDSASDGAMALERLGQPVIVESRPGAATNIATEAVVRAPPTATRFSWSLPRTRSTRLSTTSSISISSATSRRSRASSVFPTSSWSILPFRSRRSLS